MSPKLCVALDSRDENEILRLADASAEHVDVFKIGLTSFTAFGSGLVGRLAATRPVFLDLKLHDIPAQVAGAVEAVAATGAAYTTVHALGGKEMVYAAVDAAPASLTVLAVTVLTSIDDSALSVLGIAGPAGKAVARLADVVWPDLAWASGGSGFVCSPQEVGDLRARWGPVPEGPLLVVPGIRSGQAPQDDQRRTMSATEAAGAGADMLVVGRPITAAADPAVAARSLKAEIS